MSRCFPFPPPGYEKKLSGIQEDLLAKEKHKEKKHKREKKDKDRSERSKHKEKKDKKEKHKDKKKAKENDKIGSSSDQKNETTKVNEIKDSKFTEERRIRDEEQGARNHVVEKTFNIINRRTEINIPSTSTAMGKDACTNNKTAANASVSMRRKIDARVPPFHQKGTNGFEVPSTIKEKQKIGSSEKVQELISLEQRRNDNCTPPFNHKRTEGIQVLSMERQKIGDSEKRLAQPTNGRHVPPLHHKKPEGVEKQKFGGSEKKLTPPPMQRSLENTQNKRAHINPKVGDFATEQRRNDVNVPRPFDRSPSQKNESALAVNSMQKASSNNVVSNLIGPYKKRNDELDNLVENITSSVFQNMGAAHSTDNERLFTNIASTQARDRSKEKKSEDAKKEGRHKDRGEKEKKRKDKDKDRHKEKRKDGKNSSKSEQKHVNNDKLKETGVKDQTDHINGKVASNPVPSTTASVDDGRNKKRKESETNGFLHEPQLEERPNKIQRTIASSSHQPVDNGKPLEFDHMISKSMSTNSIKVVRGIENNGSSISRNSNVEHQPLHLHKPPIVPPVIRPIVPPVVRPVVPPVVPAAIDPKKTSSVVESSKKDRVKDRIKTRPPHPDTKYLGLIYSMPKVEEVPESDEQDWILSSKRNINRKTEVNESPPKVWDKGLRIEEADVFALPYVVPF